MPSMCLQADNNLSLTWDFEVVCACNDADETNGAPEVRRRVAVSAQTAAEAPWTRLSSWVGAAWTRLRPICLA